MNTIVLEALSEFMNLARLGNKYLADAEPWKLIKTDEERVKTILNIGLQIASNLAILAQPFLPFSSQNYSLCLIWRFKIGIKLEP